MSPDPSAPQPDPGAPSPGEDDLLPSRRRAILRFLLLVAVIAAGFAVFRFTPLAHYADREVLVATFDALRHSWWAPLLFVGLWTVLSPLGFPGTPLLFAGAVVFGVSWGTAYNLIGSFFGAVAAYLMAGTLGRDFIRHIAGERLRKIEQMLDRHGFWTVFRLRFLPLPYPLINFASALVGIPLRVFAPATLLGILLPTFLYTYLWATLFSTFTGEVSGSATLAVLQEKAALAGVMALTFLPRLWRRWRGGGSSGG